MTIEELKRLLKPGKYVVGSWFRDDMYCPLATIVVQNVPKSVKDELDEDYWSTPEDLVADVLGEEPEWVEGFIEGWDTALDGDDVDEEDKKESIDAENVSWLEGFETARALIKTPGYEGEERKY